MPTTGPLVFPGGQKKSYTRKCDAFGSCTPWTLESSALPMSRDSHSGWSRERTAATPAKGFEAVTAGFRGPP
jgi:hypothetical protein